MSATLWRSEIGTEGYAPGTLLLNTTDNFATITAAGYMNNIAAASSVQVRASDFVFASYNGGNEIFTISISAGVITLVASSSAVITPTIANHIATYTNTTGTLSEDANPAINNGVIQSGSSGVLGGFVAYPVTASKGSFQFVATANTGNTNVELTNVAHGQASVYSIPDAGNAVGRILNAATATPFVSGNLPKASGTGGLMIDSGIAAGSLATYTGATVIGNVVKAASVAGEIADAGFALHANTTGAYGGGGTSNAFTATGLTSSSIVTAVILTSTNAVSIAKAVPSTNTLTVTFSADPGASTTVSWIAVTPAV